MKQAAVSIVIINYNVKQFVLDCLTSIYANKHDLLLEIIVIDNASVDGSVAAIRESYPDVLLVSNKTNVGFPAANNQGFRLAKGNYIFMLNPDTEISDDAIRKLKNYLDDHPEVSLVAPQLLNTNASMQRSVWRFPKIRYILADMFYLGNRMGGKYYRDKDFSKPFEAESCSGAALFFRKTLLDQVGVLDEQLFWIEDVDFCYRINQKGLKIVYLPEAKVFHHLSQSAKKNYTISISNQIFNKIKFFKTHYSALEVYTLKVISFVEVLLRLLVFFLLSPFNTVYFKKMKAYWYTLPRVFNPPKGIK